MLAVDGRFVGIITKSDWLMAKLVMRGASPVLWCIGLVAQVIRITPLSGSVVFLDYIGACNKLEYSVGSNVNFT